MIAIISPHFRDFYNFTKYGVFTGEYFEVKWVDTLTTVFGRNYDGYILWYDYYEIDDIDEIIEYLEIHGAKRINI